MGGVCRACLHFFFIDRQSVRELRITRILKDAVFQGRNVLGPNEQSVEFFPRRGGISSHTCLFLAPTSSPPPPKLRCFRGGQGSLYPGLRQGRALYRRVTYQICQEASDIYGGSEP